MIPGDQGRGYRYQPVNIDGKTGAGLFLLRNAVILPLVATGIASPFVFFGRLLRRIFRRRGSTLKDDFRGMAFRTADRKLLEFFFLFFRSRIILRLKVLHRLPSPGQARSEEHTSELQSP